MFAYILVVGNSSRCSIVTRCVISGRFRRPMVLKAAYLFHSMLALSICSYVSIGWVVFYTSLWLFTRINPAMFLLMLFLFCL